MARSSNPNSANSQFFICFEAAGFLDLQYTVWGQVVKGMEYVDKIKRGAPGSGSVTDPDYMEKVTVAVDSVSTDDNEEKDEKGNDVPPAPCAGCGYPDLEMWGRDTGRWFPRAVTTFKWDGAAYVNGVAKVSPDAAAKVTKAGTIRIRKSSPTGNWMVERWSGSSWKVECASIGGGCLPSSVTNHMTFI